MKLRQEQHLYSDIDKTCFSPIGAASFPNRRSFIDTSEDTLRESFSENDVLLVLDVSNHRGELGMRIGKSAETFLPLKSAQDPAAFIDESR